MFYVKLTKKASPRLPVWVNMDHVVRIDSIYEFGQVTGSHLDFSDNHLEEEVGEVPEAIYTLLPTNQKN